MRRVAECALQQSRDLQFRHSHADFSESALERTSRNSGGALDHHHFVRILPLSQCLDEVHRWTPLPTRSRLHQALKVAMQEMSGFETNDLNAGELAKVAETYARALEVLEFERRLKALEERLQGDE